MRVVILHPGEMGSAIGAGLGRAGHDVAWVPTGRSAATARRAEQAGMAAIADPSRADVVLAVCPPTAALDTARSFGDFGGLYIDANATSPATARMVAATLRRAEYVDGGIVGPPPHRSGTTRLYLSGPAARTAVALFAGTPIEAQALDRGGDFAASALKMAYSAWWKVSSALLLAVHEAAAELDVADALWREWTRSRPDTLARLEPAQAAAVKKGWRWSGEMLEIAHTMRDAGQPDEFGTAAAAVFDRFPRSPEDLGEGAP